MNEPKRQISPERKGLYYAGNILIGLGLFSFLSTFVTFAMHFGDFSNFDGNAKSDMIRAFGGMALMMIGALLRGVGAMGAAGSGVVLDPEQARRDLEPWNRARGGMIQDTLSEIGVVNQVAEHLEREDHTEEPREVVKVRCRACQALNDEQAKFCNQCGAPLY
jgi:hypothetical protein